MPADTVALARDSGRRLSPFVNRGRLEIRLSIDGPADPPVVLPATAVRRLVEVLAALAEGGDATVVPVPIAATVPSVSDDGDIGLTGVALAAGTWPAESFDDWESAGE